MKIPEILILGTRGIPARHGGFETFAQKLALFLVRRGWRVAVYCQNDVRSVTQRFSSEYWQGVERIEVQVSTGGPAGTLEFDWHCARHAMGRGALCLVLGYNGACFLPLLRLAGRKIITNMDGIEWKRPKWNMAIKGWFWINEWIAAKTSHRLIADHPAIADYLATRRTRAAILTIPYGGTPVHAAADAPVRHLGLEPGRYFLSVARIEPDNQIGLMVQAFSRKRRGAKLVVLGRLEAGNAYHREVRAAAGEEVIFPGAIYDPAILDALRFHARVYVHGHKVGGTNPSLVEALWAGNAVLADDNVYNRWTAGEAAAYFDSADSFERCAERFLADEAFYREKAGHARARAARDFDWNAILDAYRLEALRLLSAG